MLKIDENRLAANKLNGTKLKADPAVPGRFIYTVEADREAERNYGTNAIENHRQYNEYFSKPKRRGVKPCRLSQIAL